MAAPDRVFIFRVNDCEDVAIVAPTLDEATAELRAWCILFIGAATFTLKEEW